MNNASFTDYLFILSAGMIVFVILYVGVLVICSNTLKRVRNMKEYCDRQFERISKQIEEANINTEELTKAVKSLTDNLKNN